jgi:hypothetical protein
LALSFCQEEGTSQTGLETPYARWPVPLENSIVSLACRFACAAGAVLVG